MIIQPYSYLSRHAVNSDDFDFTYWPALKLCMLAEHANEASGLILPHPNDSRYDTFQLSYNGDGITLNDDGTLTFNSASNVGNASATGTGEIPEIVQQSVVVMYIGQHTSLNRNLDIGTAGETGLGLRYKAGAVDDRAQKSSGNYIANTGTTPTAPTDGTYSVMGGILDASASQYDTYYCAAGGSINKSTTASVTGTVTGDWGGWANGAAWDLPVGDGTKFQALLLWMFAGAVPSDIDTAIEAIAASITPGGDMQLYSGWKGLE